MSMELYVFSDRKLASIEEWQSALDAEGFDLRIYKDRSIEQLSGFLPATINGEVSGFECDHMDAASLIEELESEDYVIEHRWQYLLTFRFGGNRFECMAACIAAAIYMKAVDGVLFDGEEGEFYGPDSALPYARRAADTSNWAEIDRILAEMALKNGTLPPGSE